ncbi:unnamed protein product [Parnassius mnemosyne]|uniref:DUF4780 domain-containing protein n=1 Tax=Parnassius mnemosyne TaxID=213953 RepID=A0AAV1KZ39_9NEOP
MDNLRPNKKEGEVSEVLTRDTKEQKGTVTKPTVPRTVPSSVGAPTKGITSLNVSKTSSKELEEKKKQEPASDKTAEPLRTDDLFSAAWQVVSRKGKGKAPKKVTCRPDGPSRGSIPAGSSGKAKKKNKKQREKGRRERAALAASDTKTKEAGQATATEVLGAGTSSRAEAGKDKNPAQVEVADAGTSSRISARKQRAAKRPGKKERAAKRMLEESTSPRGEHKKVRLEQQPKTARTSYASAAKADLGVALTCARSGHITKEVADDILVAIQRKMISEAWSSQDPDASGPVFRGKPVYTEGVLKLWCDDQKALDWLKGNIATLDLKSSTLLTIKKQSEIPQRVKCGILIPDAQGAWKDSRDIGRVLAYQNRWVNIRDWLLLKADKQTDGWFLVVSVPEDHIPTLMKAGRRLACVCGAVYVKFQGRGGKFFDTPPSKEVENNPEVMDTGAIVTGTAESLEAKSSEETACTIEPKPPVEIGLSGSSLSDEEDCILPTTSDSVADDETRDLLAGLFLGGDGEDAINDGVPFVQN